MSVILLNWASSIPNEHEPKNPGLVIGTLEYLRFLQRLNLVVTREASIKLLKLKRSIHVNQITWIAWWSTNH